MLMMVLNTMLVLLALLPANNTKGTLIIELNGIKEIAGNVQVGLYNKAHGFAQKDKAYMGRVVKTTGTTVTIEIPAVPYGSYAISAFHDKNGNGQLDKTIMGMPTELYGFSNNARGTFGPPGFETAKFAFTAATGKIRFDLK